MAPHIPERSPEPDVGSRRDPPPLSRTGSDVGMTTFLSFFLVDVSLFMYCPFNLHTYLRCLHVEKKKGGAVLFR